MVGNMRNLSVTLKVQCQKINKFFIDLPKGRF